ncbi:hypothetical protein T08_10239 [Trichinella sp. T8]|nr:hypothetical protein T08_10239 [Trichinella sp. T8]
MASAAKAISKKLSANKARLTRLLAELEELCLGSADVYEIEEQLSVTKDLYRASGTLQAELEQDIEGEEHQHATDAWGRYRRLFRYWDESLPDEVPRALVPVPVAQVKRVELHAFCDASELAYGAAVYLRVETSAPRALVNLVTVQTRAPLLKRLSLPRLDLMGALVMARLVHYAQGALDLPFYSTTCWTGSEVALAWVRSVASLWKPFVQNSVKEIQRLVEPASWRHCQGKDDPADWLSQGAAVTKLAAGKQWHGPLIPSREVRTSGQATLGLMTAYTTEDPIQPDKELQDAEELWVRLKQEEEFRAEIDALVPLSRVAAHSRISQLNPYLDERGILRAGGRLANSDLSVTMQHLAINNISVPGEPRADQGIDSQMSPATATCRVEQTLASDGRSTQRSGGPDTGFLTGGHGVRRTTVCPSGKESHFADLRVSDHLHGNPLRASRGGPSDDHGQSTASPSTFMAREDGPKTIQSDNFRSLQGAAAELRQLLQIVDEDRDTWKGARWAPHPMEFHSRKSPVAGWLLGTPSLLG